MTARKAKKASARSLSESVAASAGYKTINEKFHESVVTRSQNTDVEQMLVVFRCGSVFGSSWKNNCLVPLTSVQRNTFWWVYEGTTGVDA